MARLIRLALTARLRLLARLPLLARRALLSALTVLRVLLRLAALLVLLSAAHLTRQVLGRRVNTQEPSKSLMLRKPTLTIAHGGGLKLEVGSPEFNLLADWAPDDATRRQILADNPAALYGF